MTDSGAKQDLLRYLRAGRAALVWKLDGLGEYDIRRPLTPTGTNLLGLVKHLTGCELGYFGTVFGRAYPHPPRWLTEDAPANVDMWATEDEPRARILGQYREACAHSDETIARLPLDAVGVAPHWPAGQRELTLHRALIHMTAETHRHAGHADLVRELIDGAAGLRADNTNLPEGDARWWAEHRDRVERAARAADG